MCHMFLVPSASIYLVNTFLCILFIIYFFAKNAYKSATFKY